ncbi:tryptophanyl-tRNA synthetase [Pyrrhoderma noxium]|uniref:Tryptophan--tRNA ligase, mitochondrial n=1 Tax=Pyrrhoderma noxium TaxID=2282107 RepID=A0A286UV08_9AGAM|nr:tryptophanyl-tRNA synthetase [Pyrrhoderma noxium]
MFKNSFRRLGYSKGRSFGSTSTDSLSHPKVIFSGIQPTGIPHIGNYLGALQNWVQMQDAARPQDSVIFSVVGWHALTLPQDPKALLQSKNDMFATLIAIGLDPEKSIIFHQDDNQDHVELAWLLNCIAPFGKLRRMTTWKSRLAVSRNANDESEVDESILNTGLFTYPVLQAADILAYKTTHVPVGDDQQQHIELCRDLAEVFNRMTNSSLFIPPECVITVSKRILSLKDASAKMSKSAVDPNSRILLTDSTSLIQKKIRSAVTDSITGITYDPINRPGTSNLLTILSGCIGEDIHLVAEQHKTKTHGELKKVVFEAVEETLKGPRAEFERLRMDQGYLEKLSKKGAEKARKLSSQTLKEVRRLVGLSH